MSIGDSGTKRLATLLTHLSRTAGYSDFTFLEVKSKITSRGWAAFSKMLCDTSCINSTYSSNHTLQHLSGGRETHNAEDFLKLNRETDKKKVAATKILKSHQVFDMKPFFEWDFKFLPLMVCWFEKAAQYQTVPEKDIERKRLDSTYQFVRGMPVQYVESRLIYELDEVGNNEIKLGQLRGAPNVNQA